MTSTILQNNTLVAVLDLLQHLRMLYRLGLYAIPGWGGGKLLPGTAQRALSLDPPSLSEINAADYSGGLIILAGTENPFGGFVVAIDIDRGPEYWPAMPKGFLYDELGTRDTKRHIFVRTTDRLEGCLNLVVHGTGELVAEIKGLNLSLRSWPTMPPDKPRGYMPMSWPLDPVTDPPALTARQLADGMADLLSRSLGESIWVKTEVKARRVNLTTAGAPIHGRGFIDTLRGVIETNQGRGLASPNPDGWQSGNCVFPENHKNGDRNASFSINFELAGWTCFGGCGSGTLADLAERLDIPTPIVRGRGRHVNSVRVTESSV